MEIIKTIEEKLNYPNPVVTIGNFDGVHIGHQKIFKKVVEKAKEIRGTPIAITFDPHPIKVLAPERNIKLITMPNDKRKLIFEAGIKVLICINFNKEFAHTNPDDFIKEFLVKKINAKWIIVGHNYTFGKGKKGTPALLRRRSKKYGYKVSVVRYAKIYGDIVSSSRIRSLILRGRVCEASRMLGRAYHLDGVVIKGTGRGTTLLHTPTANINTTNELVPKEGVYAVRISIPSEKNKIYDGVANIGKNPTFGDRPISYEVHIFGLNKDLLGENIRIHFIDRLRDEKRFESVKDLEENIKKDIEKAKDILSKRKDPLFI
jgi:riboflavin kinase/FMN adenylyltransferase